MHGGLQTYSNTSVQKLCSVQRSIAATTVKLAITRHGLHSHFFQSHHFAIYLPEAGPFFVFRYLVLILSNPALQLDFWSQLQTFAATWASFFFWRSPFSLSATVGQWALAFHAPPPGTGRAKHEDEKVWKISQVDDESF